MKEWTVASPAKVNLWLRILGRREDGYHEVETRMLRLSVADEVVISRHAGGHSVRLTCTDPAVPVDESNLALRALRAFQNKTGLAGSWRLHLRKKIPAGAGLGGGSGNAAAVLRAANTICDSPLSEAELVALAGGIGADVAFFVLDTPAADGRGRGEQVERAPAPEGGPLSMVLIKPPFPVSTPWAYRAWKDSRELPGVLYAPQITPWGALVNDLERPVFEKYLLLSALKSWLLAQSECAAALMSGSGSTMLAIVRQESQAAVLAERARQYAGETAWIEVALAGV